MNHFEKIFDGARRELTPLEIEKLFCLALIQTLDTDGIYKVTTRYLENRDNAPNVLSAVEELAKC